MNLLLHTIFATTLVGPTPLALRTAEGSAAEPSEQGHYPARVTIDTTGLQHNDLPSEDVRRQQELFERDLPSQFLKVGLADAETEDAADVRVLFRWDDFGEFRYGVTFEVTTPDGQQHEHSLVFQGEAHDLLEHLKGEVPAVIALLERRAETSPASPDTPPPKTTPPGSETPPPQDPRLHTMGKAGIGVAAVGVAAGVTGAVLFTLTKNETTFGSGDGKTLDEQRRLPVLSVGLMVGGGLAVAAGISFLAADLARTKKAPKKTVLLPSVSPESAGFSLAGRF